MVLPLAIGAAAGAGLASGLLNYFGQKAQAGALRDASAAEQAALQQIIEKLDREWSMPEYQQKPLSFEETRLLQRYVPEIPQYISEQKPQLIQETGSAQEKSAQRQALESLRQRAIGGTDAIADAAQEQALFEARSTGESLRAQALRDMAQRGLGGSGSEILANIGASAAGERQGRQEALNIQAQQEARRNQALNQMANLATQVRGQNTQVEMTNADIMNQYNQRLVTSKRAQENMRAQLRNQAQLQNMQEQQRVSENNVNARNQAAAANYQRADRIAQERAALKNQKLQTIAGAQQNAASRQAQINQQAGTIEATAPYRAAIEGLGTAGQVGAAAATYGQSQNAPNPNDYPQGTGGYQKNIQRS